MAVDLQEFMKQIRGINFGVVSLNTYSINHETWVFIMVARKGNEGRFLKEECRIEGFNDMLSGLLTRIQNGTLRDELSG
jgi:hypothetical protein